MNQMCKRIKWTEYDYSHFKNCKLEILKRGNNGSLLRATRKNVHLVCAFDIETTRLRFFNGNLITENQFNKLSKKNKEKVVTHAYCYVWQFQVDEYVTVFGRTLFEYMEFIKNVSDILGSNKRLVVFVHNLSYEFQFLRGLYNFSDKEVFAVDKRKILKCSMFSGCIEYRCSYLQSNMSLEQFCKKMKVAHGKAVGKLDYSIRRFEWTPLTDDEMEYCQNDVLGLVEAIKAELELDGDNLETIPLTSTGYVRRDCKKAMRKYKMLIQDIFPSTKLYQMLRKAFRGGDTHANRYYSGYTILNVKSKDISSSYPTTLVCKKFPISRFFICQQEVTAAELKELIYKRDKAVIFRCSLSGVRLKNKYFGLPYLSKDKCDHIIEGDCHYLNQGNYDNGRILEAEYLETTLTDLDFRILVKEYEFDDIRIFECAHAKYGYLPQDLVDCIIEYYEKKTDMKDVDELEVLYNKIKNKINAIYGMCAQDPVIESLLYDNDKFAFVQFEAESEEEKELRTTELLEKYKKNAFIVYQWGVWCTAWARTALHQAVWIVSDPTPENRVNNFVYCDTDSVKYYEDFPGQFDASFEELNAIKVDEALEAGAYADDRQGKTHFMGVYEDDGFYTKFKTLGAKKYIVEKEKEPGEIYATIAGVTKKLAGSELKKYKGFDSFKPGFIFKEAGGNDIVYNDFKGVEYVTICCKESGLKKKEIALTCNAAVLPSTYKIGITNEYSDLLESSHKLLTSLHHYAKIKG